MSIVSLSNFTNAFYGPLADQVPATQKSSLYDSVISFRQQFGSSVSAPARQALDIVGAIFAIYLVLLVARTVILHCSSKIDEKKAYINKLPTDLDRTIISYLKLSDLRAVCLSDKRRNKAVSDSGFKTACVYRDFAFNKEDWWKYCHKDVDTEGEKDSFPQNIWEELNKPCMVFPGKRIGQTHIITWIPKMIGNEPLTLNSMGRVLKEYFPETFNGYR